MINNQTNSPATCNIHMLAEYESILKTITPEQYRYTRDPVFSSSIGAHLRHDLDHYLNFFSGLDSSFIDYEKRTRNPDIEVDPKEALHLVEKLISQLSKITTEDKSPLTVHIETQGKPEKTTLSCVERELDFLLSHTIHHQAIISMILRDQGLAPNATFGIAPSTLRHQQSCAQ